MSAFFIIMKMIGSIAVFMVGLNLITDALLCRFSPWLRRLTESRNTRRMYGFINGTLSAALTGSISSGVVFLISMVESRMVTLKKTPWLLLGINFGATFTGWILAAAGYYFGMSGVSLIILTIALPFKISFFLSEYKYGDALTGLGLLLLGIELLNGSLLLDPHAPAEAFFLTNVSNVHFGLAAAFAFGVLTAVLIRSSIGVLVLAMSLAYRGWLPFEMCAAIVLGSSPGITIIGFLASRNMGIDSRRTAWIHMMLNIGVCVWVGLLFHPLLGVVGRIMPGCSSVPGDIPFRLALFHSFIHLVNPLLMLPLLPLLMRVSVKAVSVRKTGSGKDTPFSLNLFPRNLPDSLDSNIVLMQSGLVKMADWASEMLMIVMNASQEPETGETGAEKIEEMKESLERMEFEISGALTESVQQQCSRPQAEKIRHQQRVAQELTEIGEACYKSMHLLQHSYHRNYRFHEESRDELFEFIAQVLDFLRYIGDYLGAHIKQPDTELARRMEDAIDIMRDKLKKRARRFLEKNEDAHVKGELAFIEIIGYLEHIGDSCLGIAETIPKMKRIG